MTLLCIKFRFMNLESSNTSFEECLSKQTNIQKLQKMPYDIIICILTFVGDWRYHSKTREIIPMIYQHDIRYSMLHDFCCSKEYYAYSRCFSNRGRGEALRIGYNIPIRNSMFLEQDDVLDEYSIDVLRFIQVQLNMYKSDGECKIISRITKYNNSCYDSSDTDCDEDSIRSFQIMNYE